MYKQTVLLVSCLMLLFVMVGCTSNESDSRTTTTAKITFKPIDLNKTADTSEADESLKLITAMPDIKAQSQATTELLTILGKMSLAYSFTESEINVWPPSPTYSEQLANALGRNGDKDLVLTVMETLRQASVYGDGLPLQLRLAPSQPPIGTASAGEITLYPTENDLFTQ